jgi:DGQHR domain-containing protein
MDKDQIVTLRAVVGSALNVQVYRGFASMNDLARISRADVYDQNDNVRGTQRDLSPAHARQAYEYALGSAVQEKRFWPEVVLNIRRIKGVRISAMSKVKGGSEFVKLQIDTSQLDLTEKDPSISRVDGNHRLYFAAGNPRRKLNPLDVIVPFAITKGLSSDDELRIFKDINANQKAMNTSHLDNIIYRLTPADKIFRDNRALWVAQQLAKRSGSPFSSKVHLGGKKQKGRYLVSLRGLESGTRELLGGSQILSKIEDAEMLYKLVENFWMAVMATWPDEWVDSVNFKLMTNTPGLSALGRLGGKILDLQLRKGRAKSEDFERALAQVKPLVDWRKSSEMMKGMAGPGAAKVLAEKLSEGIPEEVDLATVDV